MDSASDFRALLEQLDNKNYLILENNETPPVLTKEEFKLTDLASQVRADGDTYTTTPPFRIFCVSYFAAKQFQSEVYNELNVALLRFVELTREGKKPYIFKSNWEFVLAP